MSKYQLHSLREICSDLSALSDKLGYLLSDMECKSRMVAISIDRFEVITSIRRIDDFIRGIDDSVNGEENRKIEEHLNNIRELSGRTKGKA